MPRYEKKPKAVEAYEILGIYPAESTGYVPIKISTDGPTVMATPQMMARMTPQIGDYLVIDDSDGKTIYTYFFQKDAFERAFKAASDQPSHFQTVMTEPPPIDNAHVADGAQKFATREDATNAEGEKSAPIKGA